MCSFQLRDVDLTHTITHRVLIPQMTRGRLTARFWRDFPTTDGASALATSTRTRRARPLNPSPFQLVAGPRSPSCRCASSRADIRVSAATVARPWGQTRKWRRPVCWGVCAAWTGNYGRINTAIKSAHGEKGEKKMQTCVESNYVCAEEAEAHSIWMFAALLRSVHLL